MSANTPKFLDLDALAPPVEFTVRLGGQDHLLVATTVESFVENVALIQSIEFSEGDVAQNIASTRQILLRAFPTMTDEMLGKLRLDQLQALSEFAMKNAGQFSAENAMKAEAEARGAENPQ